MIVFNKTLSGYVFTFILLFVAFFLPVHLQAQRGPQAQVQGPALPIDLLLKGGHVIDPKNNINSVMDVAITAGKIFRVATNIPANTATRVVDVSGLYVSPGFIDMHVHVFAGSEDPGFTGFGINNGFGSVIPDDFAPRSGVTTVVDAGSSGWRDFHTFKKNIIDA